MTYQLGSSSSGGAVCGASPKKMIVDYDSEEDYGCCCCRRPMGPNVDVTKMDKQVWANYNQQIKESEGFDIYDFPGVCYMTSIIPIDFQKSPTETQTIIELATLAIQEYNKSLRKTKFEVLKVEKANEHIHCGGDMYYITFQAKPRKLRHPVKTLQAKVWQGIPKSNQSVEFCRLKKTPNRKVRGF